MESAKFARTGVPTVFCVCVCVCVSVCSRRCQLTWLTLFTPTTQTDMILTTSHTYTRDWC